MVTQVCGASEQKEGEYIEKKERKQAILITQARKNMLTNFCYRGLGYLKWYCNLTTDTCTSFNSHFPNVAIL